MVSPEFVQLMAKYNSVMNRQWYAAAALLTDEARKADNGAFWGSVHATLNHLMWADRQWMSRFDGWDKPAQSIKQSGGLYDDFEAMAAARVRADAAIEAWAAGVTADWLAQDLVWFSGAVGREMRRPRGMLVVHFFNHQTHHRGQAHALLTAAGHDPGTTDLPFVL